MMSGDLVCANFNYYLIFSFKSIEDNFMCGYYNNIMYYDVVLVLLKKCSLFNYHAPPPPLVDYY